MFQNVSYRPETSIKKSLYRPTVYKTGVWTHKTTNWKWFITIWQDQTIFKSNKYNMLWSSAHSFSCNCFKFSPISQAVVLGLNFNGFPLWHLKGVHRGGNSSLLLLTYDNFPLGTIHKIHLITPAEAKIICDKNAPVVDIVMSKTSMSWKSIWIYLKSQIELWNLKIYFKYEPCGVVPCVCIQ